MWQLRYSRQRNRPRGPGSASKEPSPLHPSGLPNCYCWLTGKLALLTSLLEHGISLRCLVGLVCGIATCLGPVSLAAEPMDLALGTFSQLPSPSPLTALGLCVSLATIVNAPASTDMCLRARVCVSMQLYSFKDL